MLEKRAAMAGLRFIPVPIPHIGTERCVDVMRGMRDELLRSGVSIRTRTPVGETLTQGIRVSSVITEAGERIEAGTVIGAPGREGAEWLKAMADGLGLGLTRHPVDLGVRIELPSAVLEPITDPVYESKILYCSHAIDDQVRTFLHVPSW